MTDPARLKKILERHPLHRVHHPGITSPGIVLEMPESDWQTMLDVNLTGVCHTAG